MSGTLIFFSEWLIIFKAHQHGGEILNYMDSLWIFFHMDNSGGSSVSLNKLPQLILGYIYILKYLQSNFIVRFYSFEIHNL